ncbi:MAG TPA: hypothetical protein DIU07_09575 [Rhodobacteraceae bacterium]|nr:hypothetical protein [Paracoccaceae bacterium]
MILPILRLVLIYFLLVAGVVAVFNRDKLAPLLPGMRDRETAAAPAPAEPPAPLAEFPTFAPAPTDTNTSAQDGSSQAGPEPVFPEPSQLEASSATTDVNAATAPAPQVTPEPGIAPQSAPMQLAPADTPENGAADTAGSEGQGDRPASEATASAAAQPAEPGSPAPLGTPVAAAPPAEPSPLAVPQGSGEAAETEAPDAPAAPAAPAALTASTPEQPAPAPGADDDPAALAEAISAARAAYWSGDIEGARAGMTALAEAHPDNPDVAGELGNLAFALRDYPAAAEAWHRAGLLLIARGESARVMSFLPFLQSIAPDKAAELAARLQER